MPLLLRFIRRRRLRWPFWTSTTIALLLAVMAANKWAGCAQVWFNAPRVIVVDADAGALGVSIGPPPHSEDRWSCGGWTSGSAAPSLMWWPRVGGGAGWWGFDVPLYLLAAPFALISLFLFYRAPIIHTPNHCQHCGYDLTGISKDNTPCPECGKER